MLVLGVCSYHQQFHHVELKKERFFLVFKWEVCFRVQNGYHHVHSICYSAVYCDALILCRATERIIGPWENFSYHCICIPLCLGTCYMKCSSLLRFAIVTMKIEGGPRGSLPERKFKKYSQLCLIGTLLIGISGNDQDFSPDNHCYDRQVLS